MGDALALARIQREAVVGRVHRQAAVEAQRALRGRQQPAFHDRDRHAGTRVGVQHAAQVVPRAVDGAVDHIACPVDAVWRSPKSGLARMWPSWSTLIRLDAVISSYIMP